MNKKKKMRKVKYKGKDYFVILDKDILPYVILSEDGKTKRFPIMKEELEK